MEIPTVEINLYFNSRIRKVDLIYNEDDTILIHPLKNKTVTFGNNSKIWGRASIYTLNCLMASLIGNFGMLIFLQAFYPETSILVQLIFAAKAGFVTYALLETIILLVREKYKLILAIKAIFSVSFISLVGMLIVMNVTNFMITGGEAAFHTSSYWVALILALTTGFLLLLPYNYYRIKKFYKLCHSLETMKC